MLTIQLSYHIDILFYNEVDMTWWDCAFDDSSFACLQPAGLMGPIF